MFSNQSPNRYGTSSTSPQVITKGARDEVNFTSAPQFNEKQAFDNYERYYELVKRGLVLSAHDISEGGLTVALAEMAFSGKAGIRADLAVVPTIDAPPAAEHLFGETPDRILFEVAPKDAMLAEQQGFTIIGETTDDGWLTITNESQKLVHAKVSDLKPIWKGGLAEYY